MHDEFINTLSEEWILYVVSPEDLQTFKYLALQSKEQITNHISPAFEQLNIYVTVCNVWFTLRSFDKPYFLDERRRMNYAAAYIQLEYIERHVGIKQFIQTHKLIEHQLFYFAFFIAMECMQWLTAIMERAQQDELIAHYMQDENFLQTTDDETSVQFTQTLDFQKVYVKEMMKNLSETNEFDQAMKTAMNQTRQFLLSQPAIQKTSSKSISK